MGRRAEVAARTGDQPGVQRRRGAALEATILDAVWDELAEVGYARLTMEGVAARAHTGKQVLYRRWANRAELVIAALRRRNGSIVDQVPDTGELRRDVLTVLRWMVKRSSTIGSDVVHGLMAEVPDLDPQPFSMMSGVMTTLLERAAARGEIPTAALPPRVVTLPPNLVRHEMLLTRRRPIEDEALVEIVDEVFLPLVHASAGRS